MYTVLDLFSGCGGLSLGFEQAGFRIMLGVDNWQDSLDTFKLNHKSSQTYCTNLTGLNYDLIEKNYLNEGVDVIVGGPPCQGFSISGKRDPKDPRNSLYQSFVSAVKHFRPKVFLMENVPNLASMQNGKVRMGIVNEFESLGYYTYSNTLLASNYGVPQNRKRFFLAGFAENVLFAFPNENFSTTKVTTYEAISDLPENSIEDGLAYANSSCSLYQDLMRRGSSRTYNHQITNHSEKTRSIIALVPDGGNYKDLPEEYKNIRNVNIAWTRYNSKKPSFTIDTGHRHHFHYKWNRVPTVRESARLQSFPDKFIFTNSKTSQYKQVGNAVPPLLAEVIGKSIIDVLDYM